MKQYIILISALLVIILLNLWQDTYLEETSKYLLSDINDLKNAIYRDDYENAEKSVKEIKNTWNNMIKGWDIFAEHDDVEEISLLVTSLKVYVEEQSKIDVIYTYTLLKQRVEHTLQTELLHLSNVF